MRTMPTTRLDNEHESSFESMEESMEDVMLQEQPHYSLRHLEEQPTLCQPTHVQGENEQGEELKFDTKCLLFKNQAFSPAVRKRLHQLAMRLCSFLLFHGGF